MYIPEFWCGFIVGAVIAVAVFIAFVVWCGNVAREAENETAKEINQGTENCSIGKRTKSR